MEKDLELETLRDEIELQKNKIAMMQSINDMLKLQIVDLLDNISSLQKHMSQIVNNIDVLKNKLPDDINI